MRFELELDNRNASDETLLSDLKKVASKLEKDSLTTDEYTSNGRFNAQTLARRFGGWPNALAKAGLSITKYMNIPEEELFANLERVWMTLGRQPKYREVVPPLSKYAGHTYVNRFKRWRNGLEEFTKYVNQEEVHVSETLVGLKLISKGHKTKRDISLRLRFIVMRRDSFKCRACGRSPARGDQVTLVVDHVFPWSRGGETVLDNLQTLCEPCNNGKSDLDFSLKE